MATSTCRTIGSDMLAASLWILIIVRHSAEAGKQSTTNLTFSSLMLVDKEGNVPPHTSHHDDNTPQSMTCMKNEVQRERYKIEGERAPLRRDARWRVQSEYEKG